tara:strand:+ start:281 stop:637 length:357 start_codon:yes stop_codon:yes gene_type:complete
MKNHKYYQKRNRYKQSNDRPNNFGGSNRQVFDISNGLNYKRKNFNKNNQNAGRLIGKYTELAKEALSKGDKISSENYYQHADHFLRVTNEKNFLKEVTQNVEKKNDESEKKDTDPLNN